MSTQGSEVFFYMHDFSGGGVERMRLRLLPALQAAGQRVALVVQSSQGELANAWPANVELIDLHASSNLRAIPKLAALLRSRRPSALISSLDHNNIAAAAAKILARSHTRLFACQHNALSQEGALGLKYRVVPALYRLLAPWVEKFIAVSDGVRRDMLRITGLAPGKIAVIYNPVTGGTQPAPAPPAHPFFADSAIPVFIFAGRLVTQKDPLTLLQAFTLYRKTHPGRLIFLGAGPLLDDLHAEAARLNLTADIDLPGFCPDIRPYMAAAKACIVPSRYEGFGNVIVEALSCGTPVIAADCPEGPAEILAGGAFGRLFAPGDASACAQAMAENLRAHFPAHALQARAARYSLEAAVAAHLSLLSPATTPTRPVFGLSFTALDATAIARKILHTAPQAGGLLVTPNIDHIRLLQRADFKTACQQAELICADGFPVARYASLRAATHIPRSTGCDILHALLQDKSAAQRRICFIIESETTLQAARLWHEVRTPNAPWRFLLAPQNLLGAPEASLLLATCIGRFAPDILVLTLGAPVSETFAHTHQQRLRASWKLCVGQALRIELGLTKRAPPLLRQTGCEWLWRLCQEPARLAPRYATALAHYPCAIWQDLTH